MLTYLLTVLPSRPCTISLIKIQFIPVGFSVLLCFQSLMRIISAIWLSTWITQISIEPELFLTTRHSKHSKWWTCNRLNQKCGKGEGIIWTSWSMGIDVKQKWDHAAFHLWVEKKECWWFLCIIGDIKSTDVHLLPHFCYVRYFMSFFPTSEKWSESRSVVSDSLPPQGLHSPWNSPGKNTGVGSLSLFQGIFPTQELNPGFPHCRQILYQLSYKGSPRILEW